MACGRSFVRGLVIFAAIGAGVAVVANVVRPGSVHAFGAQVRDKVGLAIDGSIDDPAALRTAIEGLASAYPERIAGVRRDLDAVGRELDELDRRIDESRTVQRLASADLERLDGHIVEARLQLTRADAEGRPVAGVHIAFGGRILPMEEALAERERVASTASLYGGLAQDLAADRVYLEQQRGELRGLLGRLEAEHAEFQGQLFALDMQIEAVARNERLIASIGDRQARIDEVSRYEAHSLAQLRERLDSVRSAQEARLAALARASREQQYLRLARSVIDAGDRAGAAATDQTGPGAGADTEETSGVAAADEDEEHDEGVLIRVGS